MSYSFARQGIKLHRKQINHGTVSLAGDKFFSLILDNY